MRLIALAIMGIGVAFAIGIPWFNSNFTGENVANFVLYEKGDGWKATDIKIADAKHPLRLRVNVYRLPGKIISNGKLKILLRAAALSDIGNNSKRVLDEEITLSLDSGTSSATGQATPEIITSSSQEFRIVNGGEYKFGAIPVSLAGKAIARGSKQFDRNIVRIDAIVQSSVAPVSSRNVILGAIFIGIGIFFFIRLSRRRSNIAVEPAEEYLEPDEAKEPKLSQNNSVEVDEPAVDPEPVKSKPVKQKAKPRTRKTDAGKSIRWGRDAGKKSGKDQW